MEDCLHRGFNRDDEDEEDEERMSKKSQISLENQTNSAEL